MTSSSRVGGDWPPSFLKMKEKNSSLVSPFVIEDLLQQESIVEPP